MVSRLSCILGRLAVTSSRGYPLQGIRRSLTSSPALWNAKPEAKNPEQSVLKVSDNSGGGLGSFLQEKTGVTGVWTLGVGVTAYLLSKEIYIVNSETVIAMVFFGVVTYIVKKTGPGIGKYLDDKSQSVLDLLSSERNSQRTSLENAIQSELKVEEELGLRHDIFDVIKENNAIRMEEEYRRRLHQVSGTVKKQLDYQVEVEKAQRKFEHDYMVQWLEKMVTTELTKGREDENIPKCMKDLEKVALA